MKYDTAWKVEIIKIVYNDNSILKWIDFGEMKIREINRFK